ncbi:MAG: ATP-binding protein [Bacilli bacterium]|nr:ATP-binding protein [Bacilli bacterium]
MKRKIYNQLIEWKNNKINKPLLILGVRQCGKTYIINEFCQNEYKNYLKINLLERNDVVNLYKENINSEEKYKRLKAMINFDFDKENSILFIDEIQESEELISELKYFCEEHNNVRIICAGSLLGVKLKRLTKSFPVGKVYIKNMYPMDFEEYLIANDENFLIESIKECFVNNKPMLSLHTKALKYYNSYLLTGGMPESVLNLININGDYIKYDKNIISNIIESYFDDMKKYIQTQTEALRIRALYESLPSQLSNSSHKFQYSKLNTGAKSRDYELPLDWLLSANMVQKVNCVKTIEKPLKGFEDSDTFKLFLSDIGILNNLLNISINDILNDNLKIYKGIITENYVANQLLANEIPLFYWKNKQNVEVDFLIETKDGIIPIEVKSSDNTQSKSLKIYNGLFNPPYAIRMSTKDFGYNSETKIKSVPLYATFLIKDLIK